MKNILLTVVVFAIVSCSSTADFNASYRSLMDEPQSQQMSAEQIAQYEKSLKELEQQRAEAKREILEQKKDRCREYGFKDNSDGMGFCLIELDKLAAINKANQAQETALQKQQDDAERQRISAAWINFGAAMSNLGGTLPQSNGVTTLHTLSSSYLSGLNRICIYSLGAQKATRTISSVSVCPATMRF